MSWGYQGTGNPHSGVCPAHPPSVSTDPPAVSTLLTPSGSSAYSPADAFKLSIPIRNNYMYARVRKALPELYAFSVCMWLRSRSGGTGQGTPFSYSVPGQANEIVLLEAGHDPMELLIDLQTEVSFVNGLLLVEGYWPRLLLLQRVGVGTAYFCLSEAPVLGFQD